MERILIMLMIFITSHLAISQITITSNDLPPLGTPVIQYFDTLPPVYDFLQSDTNYVWDPGSLNQHDTILYIIQDPATDGNFIHFPAADIMFRIPGCCVYFVDSTGSVLRIIGFVDSTLATQPIRITFNGADTIIPLPFEYGTTYTSSYNFDTKFFYGQLAGPFFADSARVKRLYQASSEVTGWGSLLHPGGQLDVLQEIKTITETDSIWVRLQAFNVWVLASVSSGTRQEVNFHTPGYGFPVMQANYDYNQQLKEVRWLHTPTTYRITQTTPLLLIYPNPASDLLYIKTIQGNPQLVHIYDLNGKLIFSEKYVADNPINIYSLSPGMYVIHIYSATELIGTYRFLKR